MATQARPTWEKKGGRSGGGGGGDVRTTDPPGMGMLVARKGMPGKRAAEMFAAGGQARARAPRGRWHAVLYSVSPWGRIEKGSRLLV